MHRLIVAAAAALMSSAPSAPAPPAAAQAPAPSPPAPAAGPPSDLGDGTRLLPPIRYKQLAVFPVARAQAQAAAAAPGVAALTLAEGLAKKLVAVSEQDGGGDVNHVRVRNKSDRPLLLLAGELILGGQQDRIIGKDTVVPSRQQMVVDVFCVEHGRWNGGHGFAAAGGMVEGRVKLRAKYRSDQGEVWDQVARKTSSLGASSATGTYRQVAGSAAGEKAVKPYRDNVAPALGALPDQGRLVGLVAAINGRVTSVDVFDDPALFAAYRQQLLESIFVTAADVKPTEAAAKPPSADDVKAFMRKAEAAPAETQATGKLSRSIVKKNKDVVGSTLELDAEAEPAAAASAARRAAAPAPRSIYKSYQLNE